MPNKGLIAMAAARIRGMDCTLATEVAGEGASNHTCWWSKEGKTYPCTGKAMWGFAVGPSEAAV